MKSREKRRYFRFNRVQVKAWILGFAHFSTYCARRFAADNCPRVAASLSYSSLLAIVPMLAIGLGVLSAFPAFEEVRAELQGMIVENLMPHADLEVDRYLSGFVENANKMTGAGVIGLGVTAILLLSTITGAFNTIWRVAEPRSLVARFMVYWAVLTLGPIMMGASLSLSSYGFAMVQWAGVDGYSRAFGLTRLLSLLLATAGFATIYLVVPARAVRLSHALTGAAVAALLFELLKRAFGAYVSHFPSYQAVYGALAAVPIFLVWMYLSWCVVLVGAEIAAALPEWRANRHVHKHAGGPGTKLALALTLLSRLREAARKGQVLKEKVLAHHLPASLDDLGQVLGALRRGGFVTRARSRWVLSRDLSCTSLDDLLETLNLTLSPEDYWPPQVRVVLEDLAAAGQPLAEQPISVLLDGAPTPVAVERRASV